MFASISRITVDHCNWTLPEVRRTEEDGKPQQPATQG
jgi:hypothetical protein